VRQLVAYTAVSTLSSLAHTRLPAFVASEHQERPKLVRTRGSLGLDSGRVHRDHVTCTAGVQTVAPQVDRLRDRSLSTSVSLSYRRSPTGYPVVRQHGRVVQHLLMIVGGGLIGGCCWRLDVTVGGPPNRGDIHSALSSTTTCLEVGVLATSPGNLTNLDFAAPFQVIQPKACGPRWRMAGTSAALAL